MATLDTAAFSEALKVDYIGSIREELDNSSVLYNQLSKEEMVTDVTGKNFTVPHHHGRNLSSGDGRAEGATLQAADYQKYKTSVVPVKYLYGVVEVTGPAIYASQNNRGAFVRALDSEIQSCVRDFKRAMNRQLHGNGTDALAYWTTADDATPVTVDDGLGNAFVHLESGNGVTCDLIDASDNSTVLGNDIVVTLGAEAATNFAATFTGSVSGSADGDYLVKADTLGNQLMGIDGVISNADPPLGALQGLAVATYPWWKAHVVSEGAIDGAQETLSVQRLQKPFTRIATGSDYSQKDVKFLLSNYFLLDKYGEMAATLKIHVNEVELDNGWTGLEFHQIPWVADSQCKRNTLYYVSPAALRIFRLADIQWMERDGAVLSRVAGKDAYQAILFCYMNLAAMDRNGLAKLQYMAD